MNGLTTIQISPRWGLSRYVDEHKQIVRITQDFFLSDREITFELFRRFVADEEYQGEKPRWEGEDKYPESSPAHPVQAVSWYDAVMFCNWLSWREKLTPCYKVSGSPFGTARNDGEMEVEMIEGANGFRLPTDAEWEYACRAGTTTRYSFGDDEVNLARYGIYRGNAYGRTEQVGTRLCNAWGLFNMHGNVAEWCWDRLGPGSGRVLRGGACVSSPRGCHSAHHSWDFAPDSRGAMGFRVAAVPSSK